MPRRWRSGEAVKEIFAIAKIINVLFKQNFWRPTQLLGNELPGFSCANCRRTENEVGYKTIPRHIFAHGGGSALTLGSQRPVDILYPLRRRTRLGMAQQHQIKHELYGHFYMTG
jgi:hypothetical protein